MIKDNRVLFGVVAAPTLGAMYYGGYKIGSFKIDDGETKSIHVQVLDPHVIAKSRSHGTRATLDLIEKTWPNAVRATARINAKTE